MKKNDTKAQPDRSLKRYILQNLFVIASAIVALVNLWLASKLSPLAENDLVTNGRVSALEQRVGVLDKNIENMDKKLNDIIWAIGDLKSLCR